MCGMAASTRQRYRRGLSARDGDDGRAHRPARSHDHLLRRRHALADEARDGRRRFSTASRNTGASRPMSRSRSKPIRPASRPSASAASARPASTASRSACRRSTTQSLKELGRLHTADEALKAVGIARSVFDRYSFDLIYARPGQTPAMWAAELKRAIAEAAEHLSLYQLTIEADTPFFALHANGKLVTPDDDTARALYDTTQEICDAHGLSGLRDFQSRPRRRAMPAQSRLLARRRLCRHRSGRAWPHRRERTPHRDRDREAPRKLADAGGSARPRSRRRRSAHPRGARRRISADGASPRRRHRSRTLRGDCRPSARRRPDPRFCARKVRSRPPRTAICA